MIHSKSTEEETILNWEVLLKTDEAIYVALETLKRNKALFAFDQNFLGSLIDWYEGKNTPKNRRRSTKPRNFYTIKQSQTALEILCKRYSDSLQKYSETDKRFNRFLDSLDVKDEEFVEIVTEIKNPMECPICDPLHNVIVSAACKFVAGAAGTATVKCDRCHQTITFLIEGA